MKKTTKPAKKAAAKKAAKSSTKSPKPAAKAAKSHTKADKSKPRPLNVRQERFAELVAAGIPATTAYRQAGYTDAGRNAEQNASRLRENEGVAARIAELRKPQTKAAELLKEEKLAFLAAIVRTPIGEIGPDSPLCAEFVQETIGGGDRGKLKKGKADSGNEIGGPLVTRLRVKMCDKLRALELHSKLVGDFEPDKVTVDAGPSVIESIRERAMKVASALDLNARLRERGTAARSLKVGALSKWNPETDS